ncbi:outer membrane protein OmpA [Quisquiliibacterium transsilvanicum]|uniref:OOP family OmpA-OmpF porin n=1 Tax=Quisquiliibacterium transsilvanicum TaxID=1549638 RepID=A0A7W8HGD4_9BURK|nr:OmpA family protein [Quisquiliibacterium transsilvanicum]MBB5270705.1 OOP family OmpA-OmpF porin [Quisquiliibacterium transsilvanicum]
MNKPVALSSLVAAALLAASSVASAQVADPKNSGYVISSDTQAGTNVVKSGFGLCWRTGYFAPAHAIKGCDDDLLPKAAAAPAPARPAPARPAPAPAPAPAAPKPAPAPTSEKVTFAADAFFDFDKSVLKPEGKAKLDDLTGKLKDITLEVIIAVGHTDSIGTDQYNQRLSVRRAEAVKSYLVSKGVEANRIYTEGKGEKQPVADNKTRDGRAKNRRVEIEVVGTRAKK